MSRTVGLENPYGSYQGGAGLGWHEVDRDLECEDEGVVDGSLDKDSILLIFWRPRKTEKILMSRLYFSPPGGGDG